MGMFDSVMVPCPTCGECAEFQSKAGDCTLAVYSLDEAPADVLSDIDKQPEACKKCGTVFRVKLKVETRVVTVPEVRIDGDEEDEDESEEVCETCGR